MNSDKKKYPWPSPPSSLPKTKWIQDMMLEEYYNKHQERTKKEQRKKQ